MYLIVSPVLSEPSIGFSLETPFVYTLKPFGLASLYRRHIGTRQTPLLTGVQVAEILLYEGPGTRGELIRHGSQDLNSLRHYPLHAMGSIGRCHISPLCLKATGGRFSL